LIQEKEWDEVLNDFNAITKRLLAKDEKNKDKITRIIEKHIGKNRKVSELDADNQDIVELINDELKELE
jgi:transcription termination factor NusB